MQAKTQAECYDYLFEAALRMKAMGLDASRPPPPLPFAATPAASAPSLLTARARTSKCPD